ncbi:MAG: FAD-dependent oxidoreductase, partial [Armatimonadota bacterium]
MHDNASKKIVILGGGIAGMVAAYKLAQVGFKVNLIESKPRLGGLSTTLKLEDCYFDYGPHAFHVQIERAVNEVKGILGDEMVLRYFTSQVYFMNKYLQHPLTLKDILFGVPKKLSAEATADFIKTRLQNKIRKREDLSF